jgi:hypothetical protein
MRARSREFSTTFGFVARPTLILWPDVGFRERDWPHAPIDHRGVSRHDEIMGADE